jgi:D-tyrosyl-tRNA(Tyr) deacylase
LRALVQRVNEARVRIGGVTVGEIGRGVCVFVGVTHTDDAGTARKLAEKVWHLRIFPEAAVGGTGTRGGMDVGLGAVGGAALVVSQFTLYGATTRGRRPSWAAAAPPDVAEPLVEVFADALAHLGATVATGRFGADMDVELVNAGPVTLLLET